MAITASKPAINIREKLSELDQPQGIKGTEVLRADTADEARNAIGARGRKNLIINGGMDVWQRGNSFTGLANLSDIFAADRWRWDERGTGAAIQSVSRSTVAPSGFPYSAKIECTTTGSANGIYYFQQKIEGYNTYCTGWNTPTKKPVTISFWLRCTKTGKFGGALTTSDESYGCAFDVDVSQVDTWEKHSVTIPAPPTSPSLGTSGVGLILQFTVAHNNDPNYAGPAGIWHENNTALHTTDDATISIDQAGDSVYITGVQLELGSVATDFEHRSYGEELALCQRYFYNIFHNTTNNLMFPITFLSGTGNNGWTTFMVTYPVPMRIFTTFTHSMTDAKCQGAALTNGSDTWTFYKQNQAYANKQGNGSSANFSGSGTDFASIGTYYVSPTNSNASHIIIASGTTFNFDAEL